MPDTLEKDISDFEMEAYFNRFRKAIGKYQYLIEERVSDLAGADVRLGDIALGDMDELLKNQAKESARTGVKNTFKSPAFNLKLYLLSLIFPGIKRQILSGVYKGIYKQIMSEAEEIKKTLIGCSYKNNCIYLSTTHPSVDLEAVLDQDAVHELTHCLWEVLGGEKVYENIDKSEENKLRVSGEGFAIYGERAWFYDFYPKDVQQRLDRDSLNPGYPPVQSALKIKDLVRKYGQGILLKIPKEWKSLGISA